MLRRERGAAMADLAAAVGLLAFLGVLWAGTIRSAKDTKCRLEVHGTAATILNHVQECTNDLVLSGLVTIAVNSPTRKAEVTALVDRCLQKAYPSDYKGPNLPSDLGDGVSIFLFSGDDQTNGDPTVFVDHQCVLPLANAAQVIFFDSPNFDNATCFIGAAICNEANDTPCPGQLP